MFGIPMYAHLVHAPAIPRSPARRHNVHLRRPFVRLATLQSKMRWPANVAKSSLACLKSNQSRQLHARNRCCLNVVSIKQTRWLTQLTGAQSLFVVGSVPVLMTTKTWNLFFPECIPKAQCKPLEKLSSTELGFKNVVDTSGCCPVSKLICDKSLCPKKPAQCTEAFYILETVKKATDTKCCDEFECRKFKTWLFEFISKLVAFTGPPSDNCIATIAGKKVLKKNEESWLTEDVCVKAVCAFDTNGNPIVKTQRETCTAVCQAVSLYWISRFIGTEPSEFLSRDTNLNQFPTSAAEFASKPSA